MLRPDICEYTDLYIAVKGRINLKATYDGNKKNKKQFFKNNASFRSCITKNNNTY